MASRLAGCFGLLMICSVTSAQAGEVRSVEQELLLADRDYALSQPAKAIVHYRTLLHHPSFGMASYLMRYGDTAVNVGSYDEARLAYKRALREAVRERDARETGELKKLIRALPLFTGQIEEMVRSEDAAGAFRELRKFLSRNPTHPWAVVQMGQVYEQIGRLGQAESIYRQAVLWHGEDPNAHYALGRFYLLKKKKFESALEEFKLFRALLYKQADPSAGEAKNKRLSENIREATRTIAEVSLEVLGRPAAAATELEGLIRSGNAEARDHYVLGAAYLRMGRRAASYSALKKAIDLEPESEAADNAKALIESVRQTSREGFAVQA